jgi:hypothetical protein
MPMAMVVITTNGCWLPRKVVVWQHLECTKQAQPIQKGTRSVPNYS